MSEPLRKPATLHDVARAAGVSLITASRALGNPQLVSPATIARVQAAVQATGYVANLQAAGLKSRRSLTVAALVPGVAVPQFLPTIQALTETLAAAGYQLILGQTGYDQAREAPLLTAMLGRRVDGVVVAGLLQAGPAAQALRQAGVPVVETWDFTERPVDMLVGFSHLQVGGAVGGYFRARGWQHVGVATADDQRARQRLAGFAAAMGRPLPTAFIPAPSNLALGRAALADLLAQQPALQAVFCSSDGLAQGVMVEAAARGIAVPGQLAVLGFGDADFAAHLLTPLSTVQIDAAGIGRRAAEMVLARCRGETVAEPVVDLGFRIVERASTGA